MLPPPCPIQHFCCSMIISQQQFHNFHRHIIFYFDRPVNCTKTPTGMLSTFPVQLLWYCVEEDFTSRVLSCYTTPTQKNHSAPANTRKELETETTITSSNAKMNIPQLGIHYLSCNIMQEKLADRNPGLHVPEILQLSLTASPGISSLVLNSPFLISRQTSLSFPEFLVKVFSSQTWSQTNEGIFCLFFIESC